MKEIIPPPAVVRNDVAAIQGLYQRNVIPSYGRFQVAIDRGAGSYVFDVMGKRYLDLGGGIGVCALGHANAEITETLIEQSRKLTHTSNLYYTEPQGRLAEALVNLIGPGKCFFCNSGAEANEGLYKVSRKFGHDEGRFEILTALNSFHGRTLAGISATGQEKVKKGFGPMVSGFRHVPYNDLDAMALAISPSTVAILIEGIQGEGGITAATPEYLLGLRKLCNDKKLLLLLDEVQCGHFRTGRFHSFQRVLEGIPGGQEFLPDGISMAKSLGGGFPLGAFWVREPYADLLGPGAHATTYGGNPLGCAVALRILEVVRRDALAENVRNIGAALQNGLSRLCEKFPRVLKSVRGYGLMIGLELAAGIPAFAKEDKTHAVQFVTRLHALGILTVPASTHVVRMLPPLNLRANEASEGLGAIESLAAQLSASS